MFASIVRKLLNVCTFLFSVNFVSLRYDSDGYVICLWYFVFFANTGRIWHVEPQHSNDASTLEKNDPAIHARYAKWTFPSPKTDLWTFCGAFVKVFPPQNRFFAPRASLLFSNQLNYSFCPIYIIFFQLFVLTYKIKLIKLLFISSLLLSIYS